MPALPTLNAGTLNHTQYPCPPDSTHASRQLHTESHSEALAWSLVRGNSWLFLPPSTSSSQPPSDTQGSSTVPSSQHSSTDTHPCSSLSADPRTTSRRSAGFCPPSTRNRRPTWWYLHWWIPSARTSECTFSTDPSLLINHPYLLKFELAAPLSSFPTAQWNSPP